MEIEEVEKCNIPYIPVYHRRRAACSIQKNEWSRFVGVPIAKEVCARNPDQTFTHLSCLYNLLLTQDVTVQCFYRPNRDVLLVLSYRESIWKEV